MADLATEPMPFTRKPKESINHKILNILKVPLTIPQALRTILESAAEAFENKSYKKSAKYFKNALDNMGHMDEKAHEETITLTKYMLCTCWLESNDAKDLLEALKILKELEKEFGYAYPMIYYAVGKAYFKLYRFSKADDALKKGFALLNRPIQVNEYKIPGTNIVIHESSLDRLLAALVTLNDQCSSWHRPDAICCMLDCANHSQNESADKNIFFGSPTFIGMVQVSCNNTSSVCTVSFHMACWKAKKESLSSLRKLSDKDLLHWECFTPNCEDQGVRCTIKKIEIFDENAEIKATIRADEIVKHTKVQPPIPKGAIRKQQHQQPKAKVTTNEPRVPIERHPRPQNNSHEVNKIDEADVDEDIHDEQALKSSIEQLKELRANNFGIENENIWRPNLSMYGKVFMLETEDAFPDPDFSDGDPEISSLRAFIFTYFYEFILNNGPVKLDALAEKWNETQQIITNSESILNNYSDITEFLLQSVKFAVVGDYICVAKKLPEAYELAKRNACQTIRFFMENDIDQRSNGSSVDDEAFFNDILKQEKNNNSLSYSPISEDSKFNTEDSNFVTDETILKKKKMNETKVEAMDAIDNPQHETPIQKQKTLPEFNISAQLNGNTTKLVNSPMKSFSTNENAETKPAVSNELSEVSSIPKIETPIKNIVEKLPESFDYTNNELNNCNEKKEADVTKDNEKRDRSLPRAVNGFHHLYEIENQLNFPSKPKIVEDTFAKESKSVGDINAHMPLLKKDHVEMNSGEPAIRPNETILSSFIDQNDATITEKVSNNCTTPTKKSDEILVGELLEEVQRLSSRLSVCEIRNEELEAEVAEQKRKEAAERKKLMKKILHYQYAYNHSLIIRKLEECRKNLETLSNIQKLLMNTTGSTLIINEIEYQQVMTEIENISKKHQAKFWELSDKLESTDSEIITEVNIEAEKLPNLPAMELPNMIQYAITMFRMQQDYQRAQMMSTPFSPRNPPPLFGPRFRPHYDHNNPGAIFPSQFNPNIPQPAGVPPSSFTALPKNIDLLVPPRPVPNIIPQNSSNPLNSSQQQIPSLFQPLIAFPNSITSTAFTGQPIFSLARGQSYSKQNNLLQNQNRRHGTMIRDIINPTNGESIVNFLMEKKNDSTNENSNAGNDRPSSVISTNSNNSKDFDIRDNEITSYEYPKIISVAKTNDGDTDIKIKEKKKNCKSLDKVMQALRTRYVGVLEFDLLKSIEVVRKNHNNSLTGMPLSQIIREANKDIMDRQQKQLCGYEKRRLPQFSGLSYSSASSMQKDERKPENFMSHSTSVSKKEPGRTWEPVVIPNDTWHKETVESECVMCLDPIANDEPYTLQCKHTFHKACLKNWFTQSQSCPTCRVHSTMDDEFPPLY